MFYNFIIIFVYYSSSFCSSMMMYTMYIVLDRIMYIISTSILDIKNKHPPESSVMLHFIESMIINSFETFLELITVVVLQNQ